MSTLNSNVAETKKLLVGMAEEAVGLRQSLGGSITDALANRLALQYFSAAHETQRGTEGARRWEVLRAFVQDWAALRRGDHSAARLQLDREELDWRRANSQSQKEKEFREWLQRPEISKEVFPDLTRGISPETLRKIEEELRLL
jgi:hypothetical protein